MNQLIYATKNTSRISIFIPFTVEGKVETCLRLVDFKTMCTQWFYKVLATLSLSNFTRGYDYNFSNTGLNSLQSLDSLPTISLINGIMMLYFSNNQYLIGRQLFNWILFGQKMVMDMTRGQWPINFSQSIVDIPRCVYYI